MSPASRSGPGGSAGSSRRKPSSGRSSSSSSSSSATGRTGKPGRGGQSAQAQRFAARARARRWRRVGRILVVLVLVGAVGAAVWVVGWSGVLAVREVRVEVDGADAASAGSVGADLAARVEDAAAVASGTPLARVDAAAVEARVDEAVADIAGVEVRRSWPRTLTIAVTSRVAAAVVPDGDRWWSVDDSGVLFAPSPERSEGLPVVEASAASAAAATRAAGVAVAAGLPADLLALVDAVVAESEADVRLELADGALVMWGTPERGADKAEVLLALIAGRDDPPRRYDVTAPDHPAVRP